MRWGGVSEYASHGQDRSEAGGGVGFLLDTKNTNGQCDRIYEKIAQLNETHIQT